MVTNSFSPSTQKTESGESLWESDQPGLHMEFQGCGGYRESLSQKQSNRTNHSIMNESSKCKVESEISCTKVI